MRAFVFVLFSLIGLGWVVNEEWEAYEQGEAKAKQTQRESAQSLQDPSPNPQMDSPESVFNSLSE